MSGFQNFLNDLAKILRIVILLTILLMMWLFCTQKLHGQEVPLIRVQHDSFVSYYDLETHNPSLVVYQLEARHFAGSYKVSGRHFKQDTKLPRPRVKDSDYSGTGYVRGHLCSAGDRDSDKAWLKETYLTSNLVPMTMVCNSGAWKMIEDSCRALALAGHRLKVGRGPLYGDIPRLLQYVVQTRFRITIPDGFFCVAECIDCGQSYFSACYNRSSYEAANVLQVGSAAAERVIRNSRNDVTRLEDLLLDNRVRMLLTKIFGIWSLEALETITH